MIERVRGEDCEDLERERMSVCVERYRESVCRERKRDRKCVFREKEEER